MFYQDQETREPRNDKRNKPKRGNSQKRNWND